MIVHKPDHPFSTSGWILEHRLVMEKQLGRYLQVDEVVHHINKNTLDNRIENLELMGLPEHISHHRQETISGRVCSNCGTTETHWDKNKACYCWGFTRDRQVLCLKCYRKYCRSIRGNTIRAQRRAEYRRHKKKYIDREKERRLAKKLG
jgi:hypothetical protein